jgi:catechol 2,3-dioxygenase-like lactoylglutathione lyase family enzyme
MLAASKLQTIVLTSRIAEAEKFYLEVLELPLKRRLHGGLIVDVGGSELLVMPGPPTPPSEHTVAGFAVRDLDAVRAKLESRGLAWERFSHISHDANGVTTSPEGARVVWFRDPDGNLLSIVQYA